MGRDKGAERCGWEACLPVGKLSCMSVKHCFCHAFTDRALPLPALHVLSLALQVAQVDLAYACSGLIEMAMERKETLGKQERALAILQRSAATYPKVAKRLRCAEGGGRLRAGRGKWWGC